MPTLGEEDRDHGDRRQGPRRASDRARTGLPRHWYRDVWLLGITILALVAVLRTGDALDEVKEGRRTTLGVTCAATSAVIDAGRATITGSAAGMGPDYERFTRNLERLGYPPKKVRVDAAEKAAQLYAATIANAVRAEVGKAAREVVNPDGSLNCRKLRELGRAE